MESLKSNIEQEPTPNWREFLKNPDDIHKLSEETVSELDNLFNLMIDEQD